MILYLFTTTRSFRCRISCHTAINRSVLSAHPRLAERRVCWCLTRTSEATDLCRATTRYISSVANPPCACVLIAVSRLTFSRIKTANYSASNRGAWKMPSRWRNWSRTTTWSSGKQLSLCVSLSLSKQQLLTSKQGIGWVARCNCVVYKWSPWAQLSNWISFGFQKGKLNHDYLPRRRNPK